MAGLLSKVRKKQALTFRVTCVCKIFSPQLGVTLVTFYLSFLGSRFPSCCISSASNRLSHVHAMQFWPMDRKEGLRGLFWGKVYSFDKEERGSHSAEMPCPCHLDIVRFGCDVWNFSSHLVTMKRASLRTSNQRMAEGKGPTLALHSNF